MGKLIYYVGHICHTGGVDPETTAVFIHTKNVARIFNELGYTVQFLDYSYSCPQETLGGYTHIHVQPNNPGLPVIRTFQQLSEDFSGGRLADRLRDMILDRKPDAVVLYGTVGQRKILRLCQQEGVPFFAERAEWFEKERYTSFFARTFQYPRNERLYAHQDFQSAGIIAITQYFVDYYQKAGVNTLFLPPVFDMTQRPSFKAAPRNHEGLRLVYAGSASEERKDIIWPMIEAVSKVNEAGKQVSFDIIGPNEGFINRKLKETGLQMKGVTVHGTLPHDVTEQTVSSADFTVLLRPDRLCTKAAFSTKFSESMTNGVPVICNQVGGTDIYVRHLQNGVLLESLDPDRIAEALLELLKLPEEDLMAIKQNAADFARHFFDLRTYLEPMDAFLEKGIRQWQEKYSR